MVFMKIIFFCLTAFLHSYFYFYLKGNNNNYDKNRISQLSIRKWIRKRKHIYNIFCYILFLCRIDLCFIFKICLKIKALFLLAY